MMKRKQPKMCAKIPNEQSLWLHTLCICNTDFNTNLCMYMRICREREREINRKLKNIYVYMHQSFKEISDELSIFLNSTHKEN